MTQIITHFILILPLLCWAIASFFAIKKNERVSLLFQMFGILIFGFYITFLWIKLQRPPLSTMGETRIWYAFFLSFMGCLTYWRWKMSRLLTFTNLLASVFVIITICKPELQLQVLMPALQSVWFIPHVAVYMFAYAVIGCAFVLAILELFFKHKTHEGCTKVTKLVHLGATALCVGMCLGAIWAKKAWGQYWSWDIKETTALITLAIFLLYIHLQKINKKILLLIVIIGFLSLNFTWYGVKYLPSAKKSPHTFYEESLS